MAQYDMGNTVEESQMYFAKVTSCIILFLWHSGKGNTVLVQLFLVASHRNPRWNNLRKIVILSGKNFGNKGLNGEKLIVP